MDIVVSKHNLIQTSLYRDKTMELTIRQDGAVCSIFLTPDAQDAIQKTRSALNPNTAEVIRVIQVRPIYREGNRVLDLRLAWPKTKIKPGDTIIFSIQDESKP